MKTVNIILIFIFTFCLNGLAQPCFFRLDAGAGKHFERVNTNQAFQDWGMEIRQAPIFKINGSLGYVNGNHQASLGLGANFMRSKFIFGPVYTQPYAKEYLKNTVYLAEILSLSLQYTFKVIEGSHGDLSVFGAALYSDDLSTFQSTEFPRQEGLSGIERGPVIESRTSTIYYRNADVGAELGLMYYPPLKTRRFQYYVRAGYTHYFRPWGGYESDYYRIYDLDDPEVLLAAVEYSGTTYNRHFSLTIGFERRFGKKKYSREDPF